MAAHSSVIMQLLLWEVRHCPITAFIKLAPRAKTVLCEFGSLAVPARSLNRRLVVWWQSHVISCSLDSTIKVWPLAEAPAPGAVLDVAPVYVHPPEEPAAGGRTRTSVRSPHPPNASDPTPVAGATLCPNK